MEKEISELTEPHTPRTLSEPTLAEGREMATVFTPNFVAFSTKQIQNKANSDGSKSRTSPKAQNQRSKSHIRSGAAIWTFP